jgi:hypothetical protein
MSRKSRDRRRKERREQQNLLAPLAPAPEATPITATPTPDASIVPDVAPISKAEMRERINEWIESHEIIAPSRPNTFEGVQFRRAVSAGIKAGILETSLPK